MLRRLKLWTIHKELEMTLETQNLHANIEGGLFPSLRPNEGCWIRGPDRLHPEQRSHRHQAIVDPDPFLRGGMPDMNDAGAGQPTEVHLQTRCQGHRLKWARVT